MQGEEEDVLSLIDRLAAIEAPLDMQARILCSCRSRALDASRIRRRNALRVAALCSVANIILALFAVQARERHKQLEAILYRG